MPEKILIVDDQAMMLRLIALPLEKEGYAIVTAMTGLEALQKIQNDQPDLVILDIMLPDTSGIDVCRRVRQVMNLTDLPIIILSGQTELSAKIQGLEAGADEYVTKPVDPKEMVVRVKALLARTQRLRQVVVTPSGQKSRQGKIIAVVGAKGGVGVTTLVANLAAGLTMRGSKTIAVEMRPYFGTLARHFGVAPTSSLSDLFELTPKGITDSQVNSRLMPIQNGLHALFGPQRLKEYREPQVEQIETLMGVLVQMAEYVLVDLPHMPSIANRATLRAANMVLVVAEPDVACLGAAQALMDLLRAWTIAPHAIKLVVFNRLQAAQSVSMTDMERALGCELLGGVTAAPDLATAALTTGIPLLASSPTSLVAGTFQELVGRILAPRPMGAR